MNGTVSLMNEASRAALLACVLACACSSDAPEDTAPVGNSGGAGEPAGGAPGAGGDPGLGGGPAAGGPGSGGSALESGGGPGAGGTAPASGGASSSGGSTGSTGGTPGSGGDAAVDAGAGGAPTTGPFPPVTDFTEAGPYTSSTLANVGPSNNYAVYYPAELAPDGALNPIVGWVSGGGTSHTMYTLLPHLASHGFVIISANTIPGIGAEVALGQEMIAGIDWLIAENERDGSQFFGKLDPTKIAASGYSMGSLATFTIASDPRLVTTVHISGGNMMADRIDNLRQPAIFMCGNPGSGCTNLLDATCDIAAANCDTDFQNATTPVFYANFDGGHLGVLGAPLSVQITEMMTAWLRYQLMGDTTLRERFIGADCGYCADPAWRVQQKNL